MESFSNNDGEGNEDVQKAIGLLSKSTTLHMHHVFLDNSLPSLPNCDVKMPNFKVFWRTSTSEDVFFSLSLSKVKCGPHCNQLQGNSPSFDIFGKLD